MDVPPSRENVEELERRCRSAAADLVATGSIGFVLALDDDGNVRLFKFGLPDPDLPIHTQMLGAWVMMMAELVHEHVLAFGGERLPPPGTDDA